MGCGVSETEWICLVSVSFISSSCGFLGNSDQGVFLLLNQDQRIKRYKGRDTNRTLGSTVISLCENKTSLFCRMGHAPCGNRNNNNKRLIIPLCLLCSTHSLHVHMRVQQHILQNYGHFVSFELTFLCEYSHSICEKINKLQKSVS